MSYSDIIEKVAEELNLPKELVNKTYKAYWASIRSSISALPLKDDLDEEGFSQLKTNYNIPSLGKLSCTFDRYMGIKKRFSLIKKIKDNAKSKENKAAL